MVGCQKLSWNPEIQPWPIFMAGKMCSVISTKAVVEWLKDRTDGELFDNNSKLSTCNWAGLSTWLCNLLGSDSDFTIQSGQFPFLSGGKYNPI